MALNIIGKLTLRCSPMSANRVLVHLKKSAEHAPYKLRFIQSAVNLLNECSNKDTAMTYTKVEDGKFFISSMNIDGFEGPVKMKRPEFCPINKLRDSDIEKIPKDTLERGVDTGAAVLVESSDGKVLLIRRALHLRTFPGVWVPPGGHLEVGEQIWEAAFREVHEETGIKITRDMCENNNAPVLAMWESTFPPMLEMASPQRHHVVTYLHVKLKAPFTSTSILVNPDPEEVGAATWLDRDFIQAIVQTHNSPSKSTAMQMNLPQHIKILMIERGIPNYTMDYETDRLLQRASGSEPDIERVSTGTVWALKQWLSPSSPSSS